MCSLGHQTLKHQQDALHELAANRTTPGWYDGRAGFSQPGGYRQMVVPFFPGQTKKCPGPDLKSIKTILATKVLSVGKVNECQSLEIRIL